MGLLADLKVRVGADVTGFKSGMGHVHDSFSKLTPMAVGLGVAGLGVAASLGAMGVRAVGLASNMEQSRIAFTTMLGSAKTADLFIRDLQKFAASTPFEFMGLQENAKKLLAFGFSAKDIIPMLTAVGDAMGGLGGDAGTMDRTIIALGQIEAKGKVSAQEMMQLAENGIPAWKYLADAIGTDIPTAMSKVSAGAVSADVGISALTKGMEKNFGGMMDKQSKTTAGMWSNLVDTSTQSLIKIGDMLVSTFDLKGKIGGLTSLITTVSADFQKGGLRQVLYEWIAPEALDSAFDSIGGALNALVGAFQKVGGVIGGVVSGAWTKIFGKDNLVIWDHLDLIIIAVSGAIGGVLVAALAALAIAAWAAVAPMLPFILLGAAIAVTAYLIYSHWKDITTFFGGIWRTVHDFTVGTWNSIVAKLSSAWAAISGTATAIFNGITGFFKTWGALLLLVFTGPIGYLVLFVAQHFGQIQTIAVSIFGGIMSYLRDNWNTIVAIAGVAWGLVKSSIVTPVTQAFEIVRGLWAGVQKFLTDGWNDLAGIAGPIFSRVGDAIRNAISSIHIPLPHFNFQGAVEKEFAGVKVNVPDFGISWYGQGAIFSKPTVFGGIGVGESGPEAVAPISELGRYLGAQGGEELPLLLRELLRAQTQLIEYARRTAESTTALASDSPPRLDAMAADWMAA